MLPALEQFFFSLSWRKIEFYLKANRDKKDYKIPTSFAVNSIVKSIVLENKLFDENGVLFHIPNKLYTYKPQKDTILKVEVLLTDKNLHLDEEFIKELKKHFSIPKNNINYSLIEDINSQTVEFTNIYNELKDSLDSIENTEFTLDFLYPLHFKPLPKRTRTFLDSETFFKLGKRRFERLFNRDFPQIDIDRFTLLPYYWNYTETRRLSKSQNLTTHFINGCIGKLYIKGDLSNLAFYLLLGKQLHWGTKLSYGYGYYKLYPKSLSYFNQFINNLDFYKSVYRQFTEEFDDFEESHMLTDTLVENVYNDFINNKYDNDPVSIFYINKSNGEKREIHKFSIKDNFAHKVLLKMIEKPLDNAFEEESIGYRKGYGRHKAVEMISTAISEGFRYVVESDIEDFFPSVDHSLLREILQKHIPKSDELIIDLIMKAVQTKINEGGKIRISNKGLSQGSPLSPILANLYLDFFDEMMKLDDLKMIRYADDFIILVKDIDAAKEALENAKQVLMFLNLKLKESKTEIKPVSEGFSFLGFEFSEDGLSVEKTVSDSLLKKPLFITEPFVFLSAKGDRLEVRKNKETLASIPLRRISEIVILDKCSITSYLVKKCCDYKIPISMTLTSGYYITTIKSDSRSHYDTIGMHANRYFLLSQAELLEYAKEIVSKKAINYVKMLKIKREFDNGFKNITYNVYKRLKECTTTKEVMGVEGYFSKEYFRKLNSMINFKEFKFNKRDRHGEDRTNPLLNYGYYLLYTRINALVRAVGLNPFLGFLHSPENNYESLVADIQELFRVFVDRLILRMINTRIIQPEDFTKIENRFYLTQTGRKKFLTNYEREFAKKMMPTNRSISEMINNQVKNILLWVKTGSPIIFFEWK